MNWLKLGLENRIQIVYKLASQKIIAFIQWNLYQYQIMKTYNIGKIVALFGCLVIFIAQQITSFSLTDQKQYNADAYNSALRDQQSQFESKVAEVKAEIDVVRKVFANTTITNKVKVVQMQEGMADQRNSLYEMQQILKVPFQLRECQCASLAEQERAEVSQKIQTISSQIADMRASLKKCNFNTCPRYEQLALELSQSQNYLNIMNQTINSECCKGNFKFVAENPTGMVNLQGTIYKDNLNAKNWYYGDITQKDYTLQRFQYSTKYNLTSCSIDHPYADLTENKCGNCPNPNQYFNLGSRKCVSCDSQNSYLNTTSGQCQSCPQSNTYNPTTKICVFCNMSAGNYLDKSSYTCKACPIGQYFSITNQSCVNCPTGLYFNSSQAKCIQCPDNTYWINQTRSCLGCPSGSFYNSYTQSCMKCPSGTTYNSTTGMCMNSPNPGLISCPTNYPYYNSYTNMCDKCNYDETFSQQSNACVKNTFISICPPATPIFNPNTLNCIACPADGKYDTTKKLCVSDKCQPNQFLNAITDQCESPNGICGPDQSYNTQTKQCVSLGSGCRVDQYYDSASKQCLPISSTCSDDEYYDPTSRKCAPRSLLCGANEYYNSTLHMCRSSAEKCAVDFTYDPNTKQCIDSSTFCSSTQFYSTVNHTCVAGSSICFVNQYYDKPTNSCIALSTLCAKNGTVYDLESGLCLPSCPSGYFYNRTSSQCQAKKNTGPIQCQLDQIFSPDVQLCIKTYTTCSDAQWYNPNTYKCQDSSYITSPYAANLLMQTQPFSSYQTFYTNSVNQYANNPNAIRDCPNNIPFFDPSSKGCIACPSESPLFNLETNKCSKCGSGFLYNPSSHQCIVASN